MNDPHQQLRDILAGILQIKGRLVVQITGGRDFGDLVLAAKALDTIPTEPIRERPWPVGGSPPSLSGQVTLRHGDARGADRLVGYMADRRGLRVEAYPANWDLHGRKAGPERNQRMVDLIPAADVCFAFHGGRGTEDMISRCRTWGIPVVRWPLEVAEVRELFDLSPFLAGVTSPIPTVTLTNWSHAKVVHGPRYTIMAQPREWEHGDGVVPVLVPRELQLQQVREDGDFEAYREKYQAGIHERSHLQPGRLVVRLRHPRIDGPREVPLPSGAVLCCGCSMEAARAGRCHRAWAAEILREAGWRVNLDGAWLGEPVAQGSLFGGGR